MQMLISGIENNAMAEARHAVVRGNLIASTGPSALQNMEGFLFTSNLIFDEDNASSQLDINSVLVSTAEESFTQLQLTSSYKLQASSPAIDTGLDPATIGTVLGYGSTMPRRACSYGDKLCIH